MGYYLEGFEPKNKATQILEKVDDCKIEFDPKGFTLGGDRVLICVVENSAFDAATICYTDDERKIFMDDDGRVKVWLSIPKQDAIILCPACWNIYMTSLTEKYPDLRIEEHHGNNIVCGGVLPTHEIKVGQRWQDSGGNVVEVIKVKIGGFNEYVEWSWEEYGKTKTHEKTSFAFQCRYCLIVEDYKL